MICTSMHLNFCIHMHASMFMNFCVRRHASMCMNFCVHMHASLFVNFCVHTHASLLMNFCIYMHASLFMNFCVHMHASLIMLIKCTWFALARIRSDDFPSELHRSCTSRSSDLHLGALRLQLRPQIIGLPLYAANPLNFIASFIDPAGLGHQICTCLQLVSSF